MPALIVYDVDTCLEMVRHAEANPIRREELVAAVMGLHTINFDSYKLRLPLGDVVLGFSIEEHDGGRWWRHFSVQPPLAPVAVVHILKSFDIDWDGRENTPTVQVVLDTEHNAVDMYFVHPGYTPPEH